MEDNKVQKIYEQFEGDYNVIVRRLKRDSMILRFLKGFLEDEEFTKLETAMEQQDDAAAFEAAHALKGVALNLELGFLSKSLVALTESLRHGRQSNTEELYLTVKDNYQRVIRIIQEGVDA